MHLSEVSGRPLSETPSEPLSECHFPLTAVGPVAPKRVAPGNSYKFHTQRKGCQSSQRVGGVLSWMIAMQDVCEGSSRLTWHALSTRYVEMERQLGQQQFMSAEYSETREGMAKLKTHRRMYEIL